MISPMIEKIRPVGINTDISPLSIEAGNQGNRILVNPLFDALNKHYWTSENGESLMSENIKGTVAVSNSLPAGTNVCIGTYQDPFNNRLVFWNYNSNGNHGVYAYSPETNSITTLLQVSGLAFQNDRRYLITGVGSVGQLLYWSDGYNPQRVINMTRNYSYGTFSLVHIGVKKLHPVTRLTVGENVYYEAPAIDRKYDSTLKTNQVTDKNFQFSYRYKYLDDEYSIIAPLSNLSFADYDPDPFSTSKNNKIRIRLTVPTAPNAFIKNVELLCRENNTGNWQIWKTVINVSANVDVYFTNHEAKVAVDQTETAKLFETVPNFSKAMSIHKNRLFVTANEEGFDVNDTISIAISEKVFNPASGSSVTNMFLMLGFHSFIAATGSFQVGERIRAIATSSVTKYLEGIVTAVVGSTITFYVDTTPGPSLSSFASWTIRKVQMNAPAGSAGTSGADFYKTYWKTNGVYTIGLAVFDENQQSMGVVAKTLYNASPPIGSNLLYANSNDILLKAVLSGNFSTSPKVKYFSLCATKNQFQAQYQQVPVKALFYLFDKPTGYSVPAGQIEIDGKIFVRNPSTAAEYRQLYLQFPKNCPIAPDTTYFLRLLDTTAGVGRINQINSISGDYVVTSDFGVPLSALKVSRLVIEMFKPVTQDDGFYYELTDRYPVDNSGLLSVTTIDNIYGDTYRANNGGYTPPRVSVNAVNFVFRTLSAFPAYLSSSDITLALLNSELPTPTTTTQVVFDPTTVSPSGMPGSADRINTPDYQKIAYNQGKPIVELVDKTAFSRPTTIRFSNKYVQDTKINGLSSFDTGNQYTQVPFECGPITKMVPIGNRILAIHEWATTVLYINERMIQNTNGADQLIASEDVIGYNTQLVGDYGCFHPESIVVIENDVFAFDIYSGVVWRYTNEGQFPISDYGRKEYFRQKQLTYLPIKNAVKIIGGHDPFNKEYVLTFNDGTGASETIAFNYEKKKWTCRYSFIPEFYGTINNKLVSFKNGALWVHNESSTYNNFYGVQYTGFLKIAANPHPTRQKTPLGIDLSIESISLDVDFKQVEIYTPEGQYSYLKADEFDKLEQTFYADILRDENTPGALIPAGKLALRDGDEIRSKYVIIQINDDAVTRNLMQQLNLAYCFSDYSM